MPTLRQKMEFLRPNLPMLGKAEPIVRAMMEFIDKADAISRAIDEETREVPFWIRQRAFGLLAALDAEMKE